MAKTFHKAATATAALPLKVTLLRSANNRGGKQEETLIGLGLKRIRQTKLMKDNPSIRGMLDKVAHLIKIEDNA